MAFNFEEVKQAYERIRPYVRRTPLEESFYLNDGDRGGKTKGCCNHFLRKSRKLCKLCSIPSGNQ